MKHNLDALTVTVTNIKNNVILHNMLNISALFADTLTHVWAY